MKVLRFMNDEKKSTAFTASADKTTQEIFTEPEAAHWLKVSRITLQRARLRGEIAFSRVGGCRVIYTRRHLEDYLASRERAAYKPVRARTAKTEIA
jgi:hypothetical protein